MYLTEIYTESDLRAYLNSNGFQTNHRKQDNENGYDVIALKDGYSFLIEVKSLDQRENGVYRYTGDVKGDVLVLITSYGRAFIGMSNETSLTKTARLIDMLDR